MVDVLKASDLKTKKGVLLKSGAKRSIEGIGYLDNSCSLLLSKVSQALGMEDGELNPKPQYSYEKNMGKTSLNQDQG
mgnify:CR=1 FL=1